MEPFPRADGGLSGANENTPLGNLRNPLHETGSRNPEPVRAKVGEKRKKAKPLKKIRIERKLLLGMDVQVEEVLDVAESTLVGRARGRFVSGKFLKQWAESQWLETPARSFKTYTLAKGWFMVRFGSKEAMEWVEERNWAFGNRPIFFKRWSPLFDASKEKLDEYPVWVRAPSLPPFLWVDSVFKSIGDLLGTYLDADRSFLHTYEQAVARILVRLTPKNGLAESITLQYRDMVFEQPLDYELLPFRCHCCHEYGHLARDCPLGKRRRRNLPKEDQWEDPRKDAAQPMEETISVEKLSKGNFEAGPVREEGDPVRAPDAMLSPDKPVDDPAFLLESSVKMPLNRTL